MGVVFTRYHRVYLINLFITFKLLLKFSKYLSARISSYLKYFSHSLAISKVKTSEITQIILIDFNLNKLTFKELIPNKKSKSIIDLHLSVLINLQ